MSSTMLDWESEVAPFVGHEDVHVSVTVVPEPAVAEKKSVATKLVELAEEIYTLGQSDQNQAYAVPKGGPNIARVIVKGDSELRGELASKYMDRYGSVPSDQAVRDATNIVEHRAKQNPPVTLYMRVAPIDGGVAVDLGDQSGDAVLITADGWTVGTAPVLFRRTRLTSALPRPLRGGSLDDLRALLNVGDAAWDLLRGFLLSALMPEMPRPVGLLMGQQGTGKSDATKMLVRLVDPSPALTRSAPRDEQNWQVAASASWVVALDNVSKIPEWLSDAICRASTGEASVTRELYSNSEVSVMSFQRSVLFNTIDAGAFRGDLADRMVRVELERIPKDGRRTEAELEEAFVAAWPSMLGGLYSLLSVTLAKLPNVQLDEMPRMADFARMLAAMDSAVGSLSLRRFFEQAECLHQDVCAGDSVAMAVLQFMMKWPGDTWQGPMERLYMQLPQPEGHERRYWPSNGQALSGRLTRVSPALAAMGVQVETGKRTGKARSVVLTKLPGFNAIDVEASLEVEEPF